MVKDVRELRDMRGKAAADGRSILDKVDAEKRSMTTEERSAWDKCMDAVKQLGIDIETEERQAAVDVEMAKAGLFKSTEERGKSGDPDAEKRTAAFRKAILLGESRLNGEELRYLMPEQRGLTAGNDVAAGFLNAPPEFVKVLIQRVKDLVFIREMATIFPLTSGVSMGAPSLETDVDDADWTGEVNAASEDTGLGFGRRELTPHALSKLVKISNKLLRSAAMDPETIVMDRLSYKFGITMEKGYLLGTGSQQPLGVFTASNDGVPTSRDVSTGNTATSITMDGLIAAKYSLKAQYQGKAVWLFHRDAIKQISTLKDGDGRYLWQPSTQVGQADMLFGRPLKMSEYVPNTFTASQYVGMFADFSHYWIADSLNLQFQRLNELYAVNNQIGFIGRLETDGMPVLPEAFARVKLSA